jgi:hypothetical protein
MSAIRTVERVLPAPAMHWVGDGFPVRSVVSPGAVGTRLSPFVLLDLGGPADFSPSKERPGVDFHPHRGFETVTVVFKGGLEHRDTAGHSGKIGPGDVQWMTAGSGVLHEEKHSAEFARRGGAFEMAQLWVNLPAKHKMSPPKYQEILKSAIPTVSLPGEAGTARVIAGELLGARGPARTFTPVFVWDVRLKSGTRTLLPLPARSNAGFVVRRGRVRAGHGLAAGPGDLMLLARDGAALSLSADEDADLLVIGGEPIDEPVVAYGPFVMNTPEEIDAAVRDYRAGKMGRIPD